MLLRNPGGKAHFSSPYCRVFTIFGTTVFSSTESRSLAVDQWESTSYVSFRAPTNLAKR